MSTRSFISMQLPDGSVRGVYCHFDGYLEGVGAILRDHYTNPDKVSRLINLGSLSSLGPELGEAHDFDTARYGNSSWTTAFHRDRGEELVVDSYPSPADIDLDAAGYDYAYLFTSKGWLYRARNSDVFLPLKMPGQR